MEEKEKNIEKEILEPIEKNVVLEPMINESQVENTVVVIPDDEKDNKPIVPIVGVSIEKNSSTSEPMVNESQVENTGVVITDDEEADEKNNKPVASDINENIEKSIEIELLEQEIELLEQEEEDEKEKRKKVIILILLLLILIIIIFMVSYSMFDYTKKGDTDNTVTSGELKFLYTENTGVGNGINITNAFPVSDEVGKGYSTENYVFDFTVTAELSDGNTVPYEVTARMSEKSELPSDIIKIYLVERNGTLETEAPLTVSDGVVKKFSELNDTEVEVGTYSNGSKVVEKTIYENVASGNNYEQNFRLRMWISDDTSLNGVVQPDGSIKYPYNNKSFTTTVNVYSVNK